MRGRLLVPAPRQAARQRYLPGVNVNLLCLFSAWWATNNWTKSLQGRSVLTESAGNRKKTLLGFFVYRFARAYNIFYISVTPSNRKQRTKLDKYYSYDFRHKLLNKSALFILAYLFVWKPVSTSIHYISPNNPFCDPFKTSGQSGQCFIYGNVGTRIWNPYLESLNCNTKVLYFNRT